MTDHEWEYQASRAEDQSGYQGKCNAMKKSGQRCRMPAGMGTDHEGIGCCKFHGGAGSGQRIAAQKVKAGRVLATYGLARDGRQDPRDLLAEELARTAGHVDWLAEVIRVMDPDALVMGVTQVREGDAGEKIGVTWDIVESAQPSIWLNLYKAEREFLFKVAAKTTELGILERQAELERQHARLIGQVLLAVTAQLTLSVDDRNRLPALLREAVLRLGSEEAALAGTAVLATGTESAPLAPLPRPAADQDTPPPAGTSE